MTISPLENRVVVSMPEKEEKTSSGIVLPDSKEAPEQGTVVAIGPGKKNKDGGRYAMSVKVGDTVLFRKYSPDEVKVNDEKFLVMSEDDIIAILS